MSVTGRPENVLSAGDLRHQRSLEVGPMIVIGVDAHTQTHAAAAVNAATAVEVASLTIPARAVGHRQLLGWAEEIDGQRLWALEDCRRMTRQLEQFLLIAGEQVVRVPPKLMAASRKAQRTYSKSDPIDALAVARAAVREPDLPIARLPGPEHEIHLLIDHRDDLVGECTRHQRRLRWLVHEIDPDLQPPRAELATPKHLERLKRQLAARPRTREVMISLELLRRIRELSRRVKELRVEIGRLVRRRCPSLLSIEGCGVLMAARILAEVDDINRFANERQLAAYAGTSPLDASSGKQQRHRLNRTGNRKLNMAVHMIAITQIRIHQPARDYIARRRANGKSTREALRTLKRFIVRRIFHTLTTGIINPDTLPTASTPTRCH
jgi:transposase